MSIVTMKYGLAQEFTELLDDFENEQTYQKFMEDHTQLIPREFVQNHGIHFDLVLRKLKIAEDYVTDFFYLSKSSLDWNCILIEIEKPQSKYFEPGTNKFHRDFKAGLDQITRWRAWFDDQDNFNRFVNGTIGPIRIPSAMARNKCYIKYVLVTGRREELARNPMRRSLVKAQERDDFKIMSFDSLCENPARKGELYLGVRRNDHIEIRTGKYISESLLVWMPPEYLRINRDLRASAEANKDKWRTVVNQDRHPVLSDRLKEIRNY
jgi:hypothetical protein